MASTTLWTVFCDFSSDHGFAWTLMQSHSLQNSNAFKRKPFYLYDMPINQDAPEWNNYHLLLFRIKVHPECLHSLASHLCGGCLLSEFVNVRGTQCSNCTVLCGYNSGITLHLDSSLGPSQGCDLGGGIDDEDNFGSYDTRNPVFRCTSSVSSTTQLWFGRF